MEDIIKQLDEKIKMLEANIDLLTDKAIKLSAQTSDTDAFSKFIFIVSLTSPLVACTLEHVLNAYQTNDELHLIFSDKARYFGDQLASRVYQEKLKPHVAAFWGKDLKINIWYSLK